MNNILSQINTEVYTKCGLIISGYTLEGESQEYDSCHFKLNGMSILSRNAKITPKKVGQFVTFWKRNGNGPIEPFNETDNIDFYIVNVKADNKLGQFVFPRSILIKKGIISIEDKEGKRAFRVYPKWDSVSSKQAERTQKWQLEYFYEIDSLTDKHKVLELYKAK